MIVRNGLIYTEEGIFRRGTLVTSGDTVESAETDGAARAPLQGEEILDAEGMYVIPGLTDLHLHGAFGADASDACAEAFGVIARYEAAHGVTSFCPATVTVGEETLERACAAAASYREEAGARFAGLRLEGPFFSREKCGAQDPACLRLPDIALFRRLQRTAQGRIRIVDIAPELPGADAFIRSLSGEVRISVGHTAVGYDTAREAFSLGASEVTHLFNGMMPFLHREPGVPGAAFEQEHVFAELITDGIHVHPAAVRAALKLFGEDRIVFISDSMRACGLGDGAYRLGGLDVTVSGSRATLKDGTLAGSVTDLAGCVRTAVRKMGIPLETAVRCAAVNPAKALGRYEKTGSLSAGKYADFVLLDAELNVRRTVIGGRIAAASEKGTR